MSLVLLADVKDHLGIIRSDTDSKIQATIDSAESYIARRIGAGSILGPETVTQRATGYQTSLRLTTFPIVSVTSITGSDGTTVPLSGLDIDLPAGVIRQASTFQYVSWVTFPLPYYTVVYQAGFTTLDFDYIHAVKEVTRQFWGAQRGTQPQSGALDQTPAMVNANLIIDNLPRYGFA